MPAPSTLSRGHKTSQISQTIGLFLGPLWLLATLLLPAPAGMESQAWAAAGLMMLMATWWATEAISIPATSLLPVILVPALGLGDIAEVTAPYAHPIIFLFLGGFMLGLAMQRWNLHRRIALLTLLVVGDQPRRQIAGFMAATAFLSMWVSNTATAVMMLPIGLSVISMLDQENSAAVHHYATALLLAIAYSASIGGIATLIGTPPNALLAAYLSEAHDMTIGFAQWMLLGVPVSLLMLVLTWWWLTRKHFELSQRADGRTLIRRELAALGPMQKAEKLVAGIFLVTAAAWILRPLLTNGPMPWLSDTGIAIAAGVALFVLPVDYRERTFVLDWRYAEQLPWGILLLFGGGLALAGVISSSGLAEWIAASLSGYTALPTILMMALVVAVIIFLTEVTSNTATAAVFLPLLGALAVAQNVPPTLFTVPAAVAASCAFMMPVATPPNAIVFARGHLRIRDMIRNGFALNLLGVLVVTLLCYVLIGWLFRL